jgi:hypothetical protein
MYEAAKTSGDLRFSFDVGHSSIGWAVLRSQPPDQAKAGVQPRVEILGTGVVTFGADDCLAVKRRHYRQQRRHTRSTRQRIARIEQLFAHLGIFSPGELKARHEQGKGDSFAWQKAADILAATRSGRPLSDITWSELWDILRWYAHNRGYFAPPWAHRSDGELSDDVVSDTEKVQKAGSLADRFGTATMAETIAAYTQRFEVETAKWQQARLAAEGAGTALREAKPVHFKGSNAAFPREKFVWPEVRALLTALQGTLAKLDDALIRALLGNAVDPLKDREAWKTIPCPALKLPKRYHGGLLFGQMIPRFDNRIIGVCPVQFAQLQARYRAEGLEPDEAKHRAAKESKLPAKATSEFLRFRWAMQLANVFGAASGEATTRPLTAEERRRLTEQAERLGAFTAGQFKKAVRAVTGWLDKPARDNLDSLLLHPDGERALELDPVQNLIRKSPLSAALDVLPDRYRKRLHGKLAAGKTVTLGEVREWLESPRSGGRESAALSSAGNGAATPGEVSGGLPSAATDAGALAAFDTALERVLETANTKKGKNRVATTREGLLAENLTAVFPSGRAPYARPVLLQAYEEAMSGIDPRAEKSADQPRGVLCQTDELKEAQLHRRLDEQTNNHLIRHRLLILERVLEELIEAPEFAAGDKTRIVGLTIEVNRELRELSGKTRKEQETDLNRRLGDFKSVAAKVEDACKRRAVSVTAGIIRKARVSEDLGWKCPYTGKAFEIDALLGDTMDKDHIIPHADRQSDSLDSLVMTWKEVNKWKSKRTAMQFIREEGGKAVPGRPELSIMPLESFKKHVASLDTRKGHNDDKARKKRRIQRLLTENYEEKEFTPRDLTVTSHLVRLGAQVLKRHFSDLPREHRIRLEPVSLPGFVTGEIRKAWKLTGCLAVANPQVLNADGTVKTKQDIRGITHLHHALDACVLGLAAFYFPRHGSLWAAMVQRRPSAEQAALLRQTGYYRNDSEGRFRLIDLPETLVEQIRQRLAEKRVVQHVPADMSGVRVEENTRGIRGVSEDGGRVDLSQRAPRDPETGVRPPAKSTDEAAGKLLGLQPEGGSGKLQRQNGVRVITDNFGVAILDHAPEGEEKFVVIPWLRVWYRLEELKARNGGRRPRVLRNGMLFRISKRTDRSDYRGVWMVRSVKQNQKMGVVLDMSPPDAVGIDGQAKCNVKLSTLVAAELEAVPASLTGFAQ